MYIIRVVYRSPSLSPDLFAIIEDGVYQGGGEGGEGETVGDAERCGEEERGVLFVGGDVEGCIGVDDPADVVSVGGIIECGGA